MLGRLLRRPKMSIALLATVLVGALFIQAVYALYAPLESQWNTLEPYEVTELDYSHYPYAETFNRHLTSLAEAYPHLLRVEAIGTTHLGKPLLACTVSSFAKGAPEDKPALLVIGQQHPFEAITSQIAIYNIEHLLANYGLDPAVTALLDTRTLYVIPQANPDGNDIFLAQYVGHRGNARPLDFDGDGQFSEDPFNLGFNHYRKELFIFRLGTMFSTRGKPFRSVPYSMLSQNQLMARYDLGWVNHRNRPALAIDDDGDGQVDEDPPVGVDLNRNWGTTAWQSSEPIRPQDNNWDRNLYGGPAAFSEPETIAIRDFVLAHPNIIMATDLHSSAMIAIFPNSEDADDSANMNMLGVKFSQLLSTEAIDCNHWQYDVTTAMAMDWLYEQGILSSTLEIFCIKDRGIRFHEGTFCRRIWPTSIYVRYFSMAWYCVPAPEELAAEVEHKNVGLLYLLAVMPQVGFERVEQSAGELRIEVANSGGIGVKTHLRVMQGGRVIAQETVERLLESHTMTITKWQANVPMTVEVRTEGITANSSSAQGQKNELKFIPKSDGRIEVVNGELGSGVDLAELFGGWSAPEEIWGTPRYNLGRR